jgi:protein O-mannosyl-transferase
VAKRQPKTRAVKPDRQSPKKPNWSRVLPFLVFAIAFLAYVNTLGHGFVFDDASLILQNPHVTQLRWTDILSLNEYRPVRTFTYAINYAIGGDDPYGYHLFNVLLHAVNALFVYLLSLAWSRLPAVSFIGALLFALHPAQTAAVAYVSGRKDLLATFFVLGACYSYTAFRLKGGKSRLVLAFCLFVLGVFSKEVAIVFPVLILLMDVVLLRSANEEGDGHQPILRRLTGSIRRRPIAYGAASVLLLVAAYYAVFLIKASRMVGFWGGSAAVHYGTSFKLFTHYLKLVILPYPLIADYKGRVFHLASGLLDPVTLASVAALVGFLILALKLERRNPHITFGLLWFLAALLPVLQFFPFHELAADHFMYLPLVGMAYAGAQASQWLAEVHGRRIRDALVVGAVVIFSVMTVGRNRDWKDELSLWTATYNKAPGSYRANQYLGQIYFVRRESPKAIEHTKKAIELDPSGATSWANLGAMYRFWAVDLRAAGKLQDAEAMNHMALEYLAKAIQLNPRDLWAYTSRGQAFRELGQIAEQKGDPAKAKEHRKQSMASFQKAVEIGSDNPSFPIIWYEYAKVVMDTGDYYHASGLLSNCLNAFPQRADVNQAMGECLFNLRDYRRAIPHLTSALTDPKAVDAQSQIQSIGMLARAHEELGENQEAINVYRKGLERFPRSVEFHYNLGVLYHRVGDMKSAVAYLEKALELSPNGPLAGNVRQMIEIIQSVRVELVGSE